MGKEVIVVIIQALFLGLALGYLLGKKAALAIAYRILEEHAIKTRDENEINGNTSDGYHTFNELYHHRAVLFAALQRAHPDVSWKSKQHSDGTMFDNMFIAGIDTPEGTYTYHLEMNEWDMFTCVEIEFAHKWDGHVPSDVDRLLSLELYTPPSVYDGASMTVTS